MGPTIFLVSSDDNQRALIAAALKGYGYEIFGARDGETALQLAGQLRFDLVIGPGHSPFVDALRKKIGPRPPILTIHTRATMREIEAAHARNAFVLTDPTPARVVEVVQKILNPPLRGSHDSDVEKASPVAC